MNVDLVQIATNLGIFALGGVVGRLIVFIIKKVKIKQRKLPVRFDLGEMAFAPKFKRMEMEK